jgi:hypothetical protein
VETLSTKGRSLCIPAFGGFGGSINYPSAKPSVQLTITASTTDYDHQQKLGKGAPLVYLQLALAGATTFGFHVKAGGGFTGEKLVAGKTYTVFGRAVLHHIPFNFRPCYEVASKGKYGGGVITRIGTLLKGVNLPGAATGLIEI